ncbi:type II toxin-antitoxin system PemK/MazF family toxin [Haloferula sp. A504]|uniref:type II toxin-antitoxin system PemK/MazF family toxin n=1 Tax=Haloferula sp. A504 TaxID=3373601 RepID=UPI0031C5203D|nr:type II toxin-antitoxin system PemK/MazF family toxin [Verrucomicrobiaceae bacterium E54]
MTTKPGEVYRVDLGMGGKVRLMVVVSREDPEAPRALSLCAPITTSNRGSPYEVGLPSVHFLRKKSFVNVQGLQAIQHHELRGPVGVIFGEPLERIRAALSYALEIGGDSAGSKQVP